MSHNLCCPECGNKDLQVINESNTQTKGGGYSAGKGCLGYLVFGPLGLLCGGCGSTPTSKTTNTLYWVCPKCGKKFKDANESRKEIENARPGIPALIFLGILSAIILPLVFYYFVIVHAGEDLEDTFFLLIASFIPCIASIIGAIVINNRLKADEGEIFELEEKMKKHSSGNNSTSSIQNTQWECDCGSINPVSSNYCQSCSKKREIPLHSHMQSNRKLGTNEWRCQKCGRINQNYVGTCGCGEKKPLPNVSSTQNESNR